MNAPAAVVLDASVLVADAVSGETFHDDAAGLLVTLSKRGTWLYLPGIAMPEVASAISRGSGDEQVALDTVGLYHALPAVRIVAVDEPLSKAATAIAARQRIRGCDAVYVALAQDLGVPLVTLDREQRERAPAELTAHTPQSLLAEVSRPASDAEEQEPSS